MDHRVKNGFVVILAIVLIASAVYFLIPHDSSSGPTSIEAHIIGFDPYGSYALDVTEEQLHGIGADVGYDLYVDIGVERLIAIHAHDWNGVPFGTIFISYTVTTGEMVMGIFNGDIRNELELKVGDTMEITLKGPNKYYDHLGPYLQVFSNDRSDFGSDEIYANFRELTGGSMKSDLIYRSASPWTTKDDRIYYVNDLCKDVGIDSLIILDIEYEKLAPKVEEHPSLYCYELFHSGHVQAHEFYPGILSNPEDIRLFFEMIDSADGNICIACKYGKDRTGTFCAMLQALAGATYDDIKKEFMRSITNYYGIVEGTDAYDAVEHIYIDPFLYTILNPKVIDHYHEVDWENVDYHSFNAYEVVYSFLETNAGVDHELLDRVIEKITV
ncbi:MAG: tyrosine-protein phosphatase [Candidatus Methanomethylophilaceae archaeon]|nr:tyrosine-protein phosphatase [Candidatus Methanomethylophilaceae archaeon]